jgi:transposase
MPRGKLYGSPEENHQEEVIPMQKRVYRGIPLAKFKIESILEEVSGRRVVFGVDVGKDVMAGTFMTETQKAAANIMWRNPWDTREVLRVLEALPASQVEVALEPSGTYGDPFRHQCVKRGIPVYRVSAKRSHDAAEVFDGVPSWHDVKSAGVIARLHLAGASHEWRERTEDEQELAAAVRVMVMHDSHAHNNMNRLEAMLSRHWPEITVHLGLGTMTLYRMLEVSGGPRWVCENSAEAVKQVQRWGGTFLSAESVKGAVASAKTTTGVPMIEAEESMVREMSAEILRCRKAARKMKNRVQRLVIDHPEARPMEKVIGVRATAAMVASGMNPIHYENSSSLVKALGLNLKERSSGKYKGQLKITKRGPGICRFYLYLAVLRLIQREPAFKKWYDAKVIRDGGKIKNKAIVALMRKLTSAMWYVARGDAFDPTKLIPAKR